MLGSQGGYYAPPAYYPGYYQSPGYNGYGCDGMYHHYDAYGNVWDQTGHYRLVPSPYGGCYRTAPTW
ncbi:MAG: hypothetical protein ACYCW6_05475 [Candidatus Xenobia bacterium]